MPKGESRKEIVEDLLDSAEDPVHVDNVLMDREFDSQHILETISQRRLSYVVPKRMQTSEKAQAKDCSSETKTDTRPPEAPVWVSAPSEWLHCWMSRKSALTLEVC